MRVKLKTLLKKLRKMWSEPHAFHKEDFSHLKRYVNENYRQLFLDENKVQGEYLII